MLEPASLVGLSIITTRLTIIPERGSKQNRESTEGYSNWNAEKRRQVRGKLVSTTGAHPSLKKAGRSQKSRRVSVPCWHASPVANAPLKPLTCNSVKVKVGIKFMKLMESLISWDVTVTGQGSGCHLTFVRRRHHIVEWDSRIDHKTSWRTISSVPRGIPVWVAYWNVAWPSDKNIHTRRKLGRIV